MNVNELLDTIEDLLEESTGMPLSGGKRIVDVEQIRDYLDDIRANLPVELRQAQSIVSDRAQLIESANAQAQAIVKKAEERARILVSEARSSAPPSSVRPRSSPLPRPRPAPSARRSRITAIIC